MFKYILKLKGVTDCEIDSVLGNVNDIKYEIETENGIKTVTIYGKSTHSAGPQNGINAATALLMLLAKIGGPDSVFEKISKRFKHGTFLVKALVLPRSRQRFRSRD